VLGKQPAQQRAVLVELAEQRIQPGQRLGERGDRREHADLAGQQRVPALTEQRGVPGRSGHGHPAFQPRDIPCLGG